MNFLSHPIVARLLWLFPLLLFAIAVYLVYAGLEQREAAEHGVPVVAEILEFETRERSEISRGHVRLSYQNPYSGEEQLRNVELPMTFLKEIELQLAESMGTTPDRVANVVAEGNTSPEQRRLNILVSEGSDQIVLAQFSRGHWVMTFSFAAMALMGAIGFAIMVRAWNRYLARHGDPAVEGVRSQVLE